MDFNTELQVVELLKTIVGSANDNPMMMKKLLGGVIVNESIKILAELNQTKIPCETYEPFIIEAKQVIGKQVGVEQMQSIDREVAKDIGVKMLREGIIERYLDDTINNEFRYRAMVYKKKEA